MSDEEVIGWIEEWLDAGAEIISDSDVGWEPLSEFVVESSSALHNTIDDAHLSATAISHGATLASFGSDCEAFFAYGLRWEGLASPKSVEPSRQ